MTHDDDHREDDGMAERIDAIMDEATAALIAEGWCWGCQRYHQPRERAVSCTFCGAATMNTHAVCDRHQITRSHG